MGMLGSLISQPWMLLLTVAQAIDAHRQGVISREQTRRLFDATQSMLAQRSIHTYRGDQAFNRGQEQLAGVFRSAMDRRMRTRTREGLGMLDRSSDATRADLRRTFGNQASQAVAQAAGSGLGGTPLMAGIRSGFASAHGQARGLLDERIAEHRQGVYQQLTGDRLNMLSAANEQILGIRERGQSRLMQNFLRTSGDQANFLQSVNVEGPGPGAMDAISRFAYASGGGGSGGTDEGAQWGQMVAGLIPWAGGLVQQGIGALNDQSGSSAQQNPTANRPGGGMWG